MRLRCLVVLLSNILKAIYCCLVVIKFEIEIDIIVILYATYILFRRTCQKGIRVIENTIEFIISNVDCLFHTKYYIVFEKHLTIINVF